MRKKPGNKLLSLLLALTLVLGMLPMTVQAASAPVMIGTTGYDTLTDALAMAVDGDAIILNESITESVSYTFLENKTITIDGGGHTLTGDVDGMGNSIALSLSGTGTVILKNLTLQGGASSFASTGLRVGGIVSVQSYGTVIVKGGAADYSYGLNNSSAGTVDVSEAFAVGNTLSVGAQNSGPGTVNIGIAEGTGGTQGGLGTYNQAGGTVNVTTTTGTMAGIFNADSGTVNAYASSSSGTGILNVGTGTVNANTATGVTGVENGSTGTVNAGTITGDTQGTINTGAAVKTILLHTGTGASCVLDAITIAAAGTAITTIGTLPGVYKNGAYSNSWYIDSNLSYQFSMQELSSEATVLYSSFFSPEQISIAAISGVTVPVTGETPVSSIADTAEYTASISWSPNDAVFAANTIYTATITITPKDGYTLIGVGESFFSVPGAATTTNHAYSGVVTAVFPVTERTIGSLAADIEAVSGLTASVNGSMVTVTGTATVTTTSDAALTLDIPAGVTVVWKASLSGGGSTYLLELTGDGTFEVADGSNIVNTACQAAIYCLGGKGTLNVIGGKVSATVSGMVIGVAGDWLLTMTGGEVSVNAADSCAIFGRNPVVIIGGTVSATYASGYQLYMSDTSVYRSSVLDPSKIMYHTSGAFADVSIDAAVTQAVSGTSIGLTVTGHKLSAGDSVTAVWARQKKGVSGVSISYYSYTDPTTAYDTEFLAVPGVTVADIDSPADSISPTVTSVTPSGTGVDINGNIAITFSEPMNTVSRAVYLSSDGGGSYGSALTGGSWSVSDSVYTIPYSGLSYNTTYSIKIEEFQDTAGNVIITDKSGSFTTMVESIEPSVSLSHLDLVKNSTGIFTVTLGQTGNDAASATVTSENEGIATVSASTVTVSGTAITVTGIAVGKTSITVSFNGGSYIGGNKIIEVFVAEPPAATYTVTFDLAGGTRTGGGELTQTIAQGSSAIAPAASRSGYSFSGWNKNFSNITGNMTVTALWTYNSGSDSGSGSGGSSGGGSISNDPIPTAQPEKKPDQPVSAGVTVTTKADKTGISTVTVPEQSITSTIAKAQADAQASGNTDNGIGVVLNVTMPKESDSLTLTLTSNSLQSLVAANVQNIEINEAPVSLGLDLKAIQEIQKQSTGSVTVSITPVTGLKADVKTLIGIRPIYNISISYVKDGKTVNITSLGSGSATLSIPYTPGKKEVVGYLFGVYVDGTGNVTRIEGSTYDVNSKSIIFDSNHFSVYGVGYTAPREKFKDISSHWAKESIDYVVGRGLFSGTSATAFSPDAAMSRGMLVTALGRLAGVDVSNYKTVSFTDVAADQYYAPYIEWAYKNGIVSGISNSQFAPNRAITREEIALILSNYAKATGYTLPVTREAAAFADDSVIGSTYENAVKAMQQAGIMMGGTGNKFNPGVSATRAEISAMLHRYIKLTIDPATAQGWAVNDAGQRLHYKDGKALTGWQTIASKKYFFDTDGAMQTGWKKDDKSNWYYLSINGALVGWQNIGSGESKKRYYFTKDAVMVSAKWLEIDKKWYYFNTDGSLTVSTKADGYEVDENGVRQSK